MVYGEEKSREMARSLLPSKNREAARKSRVSIQQGRRRRPCPCAPGCSSVEEVDVPVGPTRARMLQGVHDVLPFIASLWGAPRAKPWLNHPQGPSAEQAETVDTFLVAFKKHRGDVMATRRELRLEARMKWKTHAATARR